MSGFRALTAQQVATLIGVCSTLAILLFLLRPRPRPVVVPSLFFWDQVVGQRRDPRWREALALLLQVAIIFALGLALGDPAPRDPGSTSRTLRGAVVRPPDRVAVVDLSVSMGAADGTGPRLSGVVRDLERWVATLEEGERLAIVSAGRVPRLEAPLTGDRAALGLVTRGLRVGTGRADLEAALHVVAGLPGLGDRPAEVRIFTDGPVPEGPALPEGVRRVVSAVGSPGDNLAVVAFGTRASRGLPTEQEAFVRLQSFSKREATTRLAIETETETLGTSLLRVPAEGVIERVYRFRPRNDERLEAVLSGTEFVGAGADALAADDRAYAFLEPLRPARVLLVTRGNRYLDRALGLVQGLGVTVVPPGPDAERALRRPGFDLVILDGWSPTRPPDTPALWVNPPASGTPFPVVRRIDGPVTTDWALDHPILKNLVLRDLNIAVSSVLDARPGDVRLIGSAAGPLALVREAGTARLAAIGFDFADSDLPLRLAFPQLVVNVVLWARQGRAVDAAPGRPWASVDPLGLGEGRPGVARILPLPEPPAGLPRWTHPRPTGDGTTLVEAPRLGFLQVEGVAERQALAVNLFDPLESDLRRAPESTTPDPARGEVRPPPAPARSEWPDPWLWLCGLAMLLLAVEYPVGGRT